MNKKILLSAVAFMALSVLKAEQSEETQQPKISNTQKDKVSDEEKKKLIQSVQKYLNELKTVTARFNQSDPKSGNLRQGELMLQRGGNVRVQYDMPYGLVIVGNRGEVRYFDPKMKKVESTSLDSTPLGVLLAEHVDLEKDVKVIDVRRSFGSIRVMVTKEGFGNGGYLILVLSENPMALRQWALIDQKNNQINLSLVNPIYNGSIDSKYFDLNTVNKRFEK